MVGLRVVCFAYCIATAVLGHADYDPQELGCGDALRATVGRGPRVSGQFGSVPVALVRRLAVYWVAAVSSMSTFQPFLAAYAKMSVARFPLVHVRTGAVRETRSLDLLTTIPAQKCGAVILMA